MDLSFESTTEQREQSVVSGSDYFRLDEGLFPFSTRSQPPPLVDSHDFVLPLHSARVKMEQFWEALPPPPLPALASGSVESAKQLRLKQMDEGPCRGTLQPAFNQ